MDVLTDALEAIHVKSMLTGRLELTAPWGLGPALLKPSFLVVTRGACWMQVEDAAPVQLSGGDFVMLPHGVDHSVRDQLTSTVIPVNEALSSGPQRRECQPGGVFRFGGGGAETTLIAGTFQFDHGDSNPLLRALPKMIHIRGDKGTPMPWLDASLQFISMEMTSGQPGAETIVSRLADILFVQAIRAHVANSADTRGWLRALSDPQIGQALSLIHERPHEPWTVESLAAGVAMSRSVFAARFSDLVEEPPLTYLTRWRMQRATRLLRSGAATIAEVADQVGYDAEAAFSKAFKRWVGTAPGAYRDDNRRNVRAAH